MRDDRGSKKGGDVSDRDMRVSDSERDETAEQLTEHFAAGRLDHSEFAERTEKALSARTRGELDEVLLDLPAVPATFSPPTAVAAPTTSGPAMQAARSEWRQKMLAPWAIFAVFFVVIWVATGAGYFWPIWPILGWGIGVALSGVAAHRTVETSPAPGIDPPPLKD